MKPIKSMHELLLVKEKLKYKEALSEKNLTGNTAKLIENFTDDLKDFTFDLAMNIALKLFTRNEKETDN